MKKMISLLAAFVVVFVFGITNVKADANSFTHAEESNALDELKSNYPSAILGGYCYYNQTGRPYDGSLEYFEVIVAYEANTANAASDSNHYIYDSVDAVYYWKAGRQCAPIIVVNDVRGDNDPATSATNIDVYAAYSLQDYLLHIPNKENSRYVLQRTFLLVMQKDMLNGGAITKYYNEKPEVKMTCEYEYNDAGKKKITFEFGDDGSIVGINGYEYDKMGVSDFGIPDGVKNLHLSTEFLASVYFKQIGMDHCPTLKFCNPGYKALGIDDSWLYLSDTGDRFKSGQCVVTSCSNLNSPECDPSKKNTCVAFDSFESTDEGESQKFEYCQRVLQTKTIDDDCTQKCVSFVETYNDGKYANTDAHDCGLSGEIVAWIENILRWIKYIVPVILIVLSILDFIKAIASEKEDEMKKAQKHFTTRLIAAVLIFLMPILIEFILDKMGFSAEDCGISNIGF